MHVAIGLMGSDSSPQQLFLGVLQAAEHSSSSVSFVVLAATEEMEALSQMAKNACLEERIFFHAAPSVISMEDDPLLAVRRKKDSSLVLGMHLLQTGEVDALVSAGNTGALITAARIVLPMLPGIRRPALLAMLPAKDGVLAIIDVGGNINNTPASLLQYAYMGAAYQRCCNGIKVPSVGLLNIGKESNKGTSIHKQAYAGLQRKAAGHRFKFSGNIEARDLFEGKADVLVTDGVTGNILLKAVEGTATFVLHCVKERHKHTVDMEVLASRFDYAEYPGALVCGVEGIVVKCHGSASERSIYNAAMGAVLYIKKRLIPHLKSDLLSC